ncbi:MAG: hypothetical protein ACFE0S_00340 [Rhodospirillales bacterium]
MRVQRLAGLLFLSALAVQSITAAHAMSEGAGQVVEFREQNQQAYELIRPDLQSMPNADFHLIMTAIIDLDRDGKAEIAWRDEDGDTPMCIANQRCPFGIFSVNENGVVTETFRGFARHIRLRPDTSGMQMIEIDGAELWRWDGTNYVIDTNFFDQTFELSPVPPDSLQPVTELMRAAGLKVYSDDDLRYANFDVDGDEIDELFIYQGSNATCSELGCNIYGFNGTDGYWFMDAVGVPQIAVAKPVRYGARFDPDAVHDGVPDIIVFHGPQGFTRMTWDGDKGDYRAIGRITPK